MPSSPPVILEACSCVDSRVNEIPVDGPRSFQEVFYFTKELKVYILTWYTNDVTVLIGLEQVLLLSLPWALNTENT